MEPPTKLIRKQNVTTSIRFHRIACRALSEREKKPFDQIGLMLYERRLMMKEDTKPLKRSAIDACDATACTRK